MSQQLHTDTDKYSAGWQMCYALGFFLIEIFAALVFELAAKGLYTPKDTNEKIALFSLFLAIVTSLLSTAFTISNLFCSKKTEKAIFKKLEAIEKSVSETKVR